MMRLLAPVAAGLPLGGISQTDALMLLGIHSLERHLKQRCCATSKALHAFKVPRSLEKVPSYLELNVPCPALLNPEGLNRLEANLGKINAQNKAPRSRRSSCFGR